MLLKLLVYFSQKLEKQLEKLLKKLEEQLVPFLEDLVVYLEEEEEDITIIIITTITTNLLQKKQIVTARGFVSRMANKMTSTEFDALKAMRSKFTRQYRNLSATKREALRKETLGLLSSKVSKHYRLGMLAWFQKGIKKSFVKNESRESRFIKKFSHDGQFADVQKLRAIREKFQNKYKFLHGEERIRFQKKTEEWIKKQAKSLGPKVDPKGMLKWFTKKLSNKKKSCHSKKSCCSTS